MAERVLPQSKSELLDDIEREWSALMVTIEKLAPDKMVAPDAGGWSPKDNIAHLTEWMKILIGYYLDHRPAHEVVGVAPEVTERWYLNQMNMIFFERNHSRSTSEVVDELKLVYAEVVARLESTPFEELMKPSFGDPSHPPLIESVLGNTSEHFAEHRENIEKNLAG